MVTGPVELRKRGKNYLNFNVALRANYHANNSAKKKFKALMSEQISKLPRMHPPVFISFNYYFRDRRPDLDNIDAMVRKYFQDALVELGRLKKDTTHFIIGTSAFFCGVDSKNPRVEITIEQFNPRIHRVSNTNNNMLF